MQLAALLDPALDRTRQQPRAGTQKWGQSARRSRHRATWTKAQILEAWLNLLAFRGELEGIDAAAQLFGKAPPGSTRAESPLLAALLRAPSARPRASRSARARTRERSTPARRASRSRPLRARSFDRATHLADA